MPLIRITVVLLLLAGNILQARGVRVMFDPRRADIGPFPTDFLTVPDAGQRTGRRVNLPLPDCGREPSTCGEISIVNQYDGFNIQARLSVCFTGPIDPDTLRAGVFYVWLEPLSQDEFGQGPAGKLSPINQVYYDPATNTGYAKPDDALDQTRRYAIIVTDAVRDAAGDPVEPDFGFQACLDRLIGGSYCDVLSGAVARAATIFPGRRIVGGSVFTTLSGTAFLERARTAIQDSAASFQLAGTTSIFTLNNLRSMVWRPQVRTSGEQLQNVPFPVPPALLAQAGVGRVAFASLRSPRFLTPQQVIPQLATGIASLPLPPESEEIFFHVWLPATPPPPGGYPVILAGHGLGDSRFGMPTALALGVAARGFAVVAMNAVGHGGGLLGRFLITDAAGNQLDLPAPGRGVDIDQNGQIDGFEGCVILAPGAPINIRDCLRQTALDYAQLVRALRQGMDLDGDGRPDLDGSRLAYLGQSLGGFYGSLLTAIEPDLPVSILNVAGGTAAEVGRWSPSLRALAQVYLAIRQPTLLNRGFDFEDQSVLRYQPARLLTEPGAAEIQNLFEMIEWIEAPGAPQTFAPHFKSSTLAGVPIKRVLFQIALGDQTVPNPANSSLIRAANMRQTTSLYRHDLARAAVPQLVANPHAFLASLGSPAALAIALAAQQQAVEFILSGREEVPDVNPLVAPMLGGPVFEVPAFLPEGLNFQRP